MVSRTRKAAAAPLSSDPAEPSAPITAELGTTGLRRSGGYVTEELLTKLAGRRGAKVYREMSDNSPVVGAVLYVIEMLLRQVEWRFEPADESPRAVEAKEFVDEVFDDMAHSFDDMIGDALSMLPFGWAYCETVFKVRGGESTDPYARSKYSDGRVGLRKVALRGQDTLERWQFTEAGDVVGLWQMDPVALRGPVFIPLTRAILFRTTAKKNNPEGRSMLRNAYRPWYFAKRLEEIEAIGMERDLTGLPVIELPAEIMSPQANAGQLAIRHSFETLVQQIRRDEREGIVMPSSTDREGKSTGYKFSLVASPGRRSIDTSPIITRHEQRIAMTCLAEFLFLGTGSVGSWSLASSKTALFAKACGGVCEMITSPINRDLIPRLMRLNGFTAEETPKLVAGDLETPPLEEIASFVNALVQAAVIVPDAALERKLREMGGLPQPPDEGAAAKRPQPDLPQTLPDALEEGQPKPAPAPKPKPTVAAAPEDEDDAAPPQA